MEFPRPEYWSGQPFPSLGDLPNPGIEPTSPTLQAYSLPSEPQGISHNSSYLKMLHVTAEIVSFVNYIVIKCLTVTF